MVVLKSERTTSCLQLTIYAESVARIVNSGNTECNCVGFFVSSNNCFVGRTVAATLGRYFRQDATGTSFRIDQLKRRCREVVLSVVVS